jgi:molybdopterin synthase sulfur carrier subunit
MMSVSVKFFAIARDIVGRSEKIMTVPAGSTTSTVLDALMAEHPKMEVWKNHLRIAVNLEYVSPGHKLQDRDEVAIIPPVSGG